ncbi:MAG: hypothetical protein MR601_04175 [Erysipelotrichaceae bacterium]|nr:hypothetical protein [Erysipelotrichaceae bacterium]
MEGNMISIYINTKYLKRSYVKNDKKWYVFIFPRNSRLYGDEIHILEKLIHAEDFMFKLKVPCDFKFNALKVKKEKNKYESVLDVKINAEILKEEIER